MRHRTTKISALAAVIALVSFANIGALGIVPVPTTPQDPSGTVVPVSAGEFAKKNPNKGGSSWKG